MRRAVLACAALGLSLPAAAQQQVAAAGDLRGMSLADLLEVDISTGTSKFIREAPAIAYVVTAEDIARLGARNILEVLEAIPGINVHLHQSPVTNAPLVDVRGSFTQRGGHVLFLRDGKPLRSLGNNTLPEIFRLPVQFVERVEIARGPGSSVYGADALVGTVNIVTRKAPGEAGLRSGDPGHRAGWAGLHGRLQRLEWSLALTHSRNEDEAFTRVQPGSRTFTQDWRHEYDDLDLKLRHGPWSASFWALNYDKSEFGNPGNPRGATFVKTQHRHADLAYESSLGRTTRLKAIAFHTRFHSLRIGEVRNNMPQDDEGEEERWTLDVAVTETRFENHRLRASAGVFRERRREITPPPRPPNAPAPFQGHRVVRYVALQDEWRFARNFELTFGLRADHYEGYGSIRNPRAGLVWTPTPQLTAKLLAGEAFRGPVYGDQGLAGRTAERMRNTELAFDWRPRADWSLVLSVFDYRARDLLEGPPQNPLLARREGKGSELSVGWQAAPAWRFDLGIAYVDARDRATGARVPLTARETAKFAVGWQPSPRLDVNLRWEAYFDRVRPRNDPRPALDDLDVGHLVARYAVTPRWTASLAVHNLADRRAWVPYVTGPQDVRLLERSTHAQLEYRF